MDELELETPEKQTKKTLVDKAINLVGHVGLGMLIMVAVRIVMNLGPKECAYLNESGAEITTGYSLDHGAAPQILFKGKRFRTTRGNETELSEADANAARVGFRTCIRLNDGKIFIAGKNQDLYDVTNGSEIYEPKTRKSIDGPNMKVGCIRPTLTLLKDGRVLITGGFQDLASGPTDAISIFDPAAKEIRLIGHLRQARAEHTCLQVSSSKVLVGGGKIEPFKCYPCGETTGVVESIDLKIGKSSFLQMAPPGAGPNLIRDDNKDIFIIGGYVQASDGDTCWQSQVTKLDIPREQID